MIIVSACHGGRGALRGEGGEKNKSKKKTHVFVTIDPLCFERYGTCVIWCRLIVSPGWIRLFIVLEAPVVPGEIVTKKISIPSLKRVRGPGKHIAFSSVIEPRLVRTQRCPASRSHLG